MKPSSYSLKMIKNITAVVLFFMTCAFTIPEHDEMIGYFQFESCNGQLCVEIHLEKLNLAGALMMEKDCKPNQMLSVCGDEYLQENFTVEVNEQKETFELLEVIVEKKYVIYRYATSNTNESIQQLNIKNTYLNQFNEHGFSRLKFMLNDEVRHFKMSKERQNIKVVY